MGSMVWGLGILGTVVLVGACATPNFGDGLATDGDAIRLPDRRGQSAADAGKAKPSN